VPRSLRLLSDVAWRLLVILALTAVLGVVLARLRVVWLPLFFALLLAALLLPLRRLLENLGLPRWTAALLVIAVAGAVLIGTAAWLTTTLAGEAVTLQSDVSAGVDELARFATHGPFHLSQDQVDHFVAQLRADWSAEQPRIARGALSNAPLAFELVLGAVLALVLAVFFVIDGDGLAISLTRAISDRSGVDIEAPLLQIWHTLVVYARAVLLNGVLNAAVIGGGLEMLGVPLALPIAALTFVGSFFPIVGALVAGAIAVAVALASQGPATALAVVALALLVHALEAYLVGPLVLGRATHLHPLVVLLAISIGSAAAGIAGALIAVPVVASVVAVVRTDR
jgi:predicted PurR-regulated permease PerM